MIQMLGIYWTNFKKIKFLFLILPKNFMYFLIGTTNIPKSEAIEQVLRESPYIWEDLHTSKFKVNSWVPDMPITLKDIKNGAKNRTIELRKIDPNADFYIWMEWWVYKDFEWENYWIMWVVYIENQEGIGHYWYSYHLEVPEKVVKILHNWNWLDLEEIMHSLGAEANIGGTGWSPSLWTDGVLVRKDEFIFAAQAALAPFFNKYYR